MIKKYYVIHFLMGITLFSVSCTGEKVSDQVVIDSLNSQLKLVMEADQRIIDNKKLVADFYQDFFGNKNIDALDKYIGDRYVQHNPMLPDGKEALRNAAKEWFKEASKEEVDIQHLGADGDFVYIHTKAKFGDNTYSVIDIFRLENGRIVEHWDVIQEVPEKSANPHPMF